MKDPLSKKLKLLFVSSDKFPPFRVDVSVLFKEKIVDRGHNIDWLMQSEEKLDKSKKIKWDACDAYIARTNNGTSKAKRLKKNIYRLLNELKLLYLLWKRRYDFIIVKDLFVSAVFAIISLSGTDVAAQSRYVFIYTEYIVNRKSSIYLQNNIFTILMKLLY